MNSKNTVEIKWNKMNKKSKKWYRFIEVSLFKNVPLMLGLVILLELINGYRNVNLSAFLVSTMIKIVVAYFIGIICGGMEWDFIEMLIHRKFTNIKKLKRKYVFIYGLIFFGTNVTIALLNPMFESMVLTITKLIMYPLAGLVWGAIMGNITGSNLKRFIPMKNLLNENIIK